MTATRRRRSWHCAATAITAVLVATIAGCTSSASSRPGGASTTATVASTLGSAPAAPTSIPVTSSPPATPASTPATRTPTTSAPPRPARSATTPTRSSCHSLQIRVIRGSASQGQEFAALQFVNTGSARCVLYGYPDVTLLLHGTAIGTAARPSGGGASSRQLAPGETAESRLHDYTTCSAELSDSARVTAPGTSISVVRPAQLRACALRVDPLSAPQ